MFGVCLLVQTKFSFFYFIFAILRYVLLIAKLRIRIFSKISKLFLFMHSHFFFCFFLSKFYKHCILQKKKIKKKFKFFMTDSWDLLCDLQPICFLNQNQLERAWKPLNSSISFIISKLIALRAISFFVSVRHSHKTSQTRLLKKVCAVRRFILTIAFMLDFFCCA